MAKIMLAVKPKYPTRRAVEKVLYNNGEFVDIVEVDTPAQALSLMGTSYVALVANDKYYPIDETTVFDQYEVVEQGGAPTIEEKEDFGIKKLEAFAEAMEAAKIQENVSIYNGIINANLLKVVDYSTLGIAEVNANGYWLCIKVNVADANAAGYSDIKFYDGTAAVDGANYIFCGTSVEDIAKKIIGLNATLTQDDVTEAVEFVFSKKITVETLVPTGNEDTSEVNAIEVDGVACATIEEAFERVTSSGSITVNKPSTISTIINIKDGKSVTLNVNANITFSGTSRFNVCDGTLIIIGNGTASIVNANGHVVCSSNTDDTKDSVVTVKNISLTGKYDAIVNVAKTCNSAFTFENAELNGLYYGFASNGDSTGTTVTATNSSFIGTDATASDEPLGAYLPADGTYAFTNCTFKSINTGVEIRAGKMTLSGCSIYGGTDLTPAMHAAGSGSTSIGAGLAVAQHTTQKKIEVSVTNCNISAAAPILEGNPQNNPTATEDTTIKVYSGGFVGGAIKTIADTDCTKFLYGGSYKVEPDDKYVATGYKKQVNASGAFEIVAE